MELRSWFEKAVDTIRQTEGVFVNFISAIAPWGAPTPAAYMSFDHMVRVLDFPFWLAFVIAIVIECLGLATVSTILSFWSYNRRYTDERKQAPIGLTILAFAFYLGIVLAMNVAIDATAAYDLAQGTKSSDIAEIIVRALLTLMSIPAALIMAVRTQHQEVLNDGEESKRERAFKKHYGENWFEMMYGKPAEVLGGSLGSENQRTKAPSPKSLEVKAYITRKVAETKSLPVLEDIIEDCKVVKSYASTLRKEWVSENPDWNTL